MFIKQSNDDKVDPQEKSTIEKDLIIFALPRTLSEYKQNYNYVNEIRNILIENKDEDIHTKIIVLYSIELDSMIGWKNNEMDILENFQQSSKSLISSLRCSESIKIFAEWDFKYSNLLSNRSLHEKVVLVIGSGGREHAMAVSLAKSIHVSKVLVCPGNGGTVDCGKISNAPSLNNIDAIVKYCSNVENHVDLVAIGPEAFLVDGIVNLMKEKCPNVNVFGPSKEAAMLEASKVGYISYFY